MIGGINDFFLLYRFPTFRFQLALISQIINLLNGHHPLTIGLMYLPCIA